MPKVSVIILNWNGKRFLKDCLGSFKKVKYKEIEIVLVDNNSSDGSQAFVKKHFPWVKLIESRTNNGFAGGNNIGAEVATGDYYLFINNDTVVEPDFLRGLMARFLKDPLLGCVQPRMRVLNEKALLDEAGAYMTPNGFLYHYGYRKPFILKPYKIPRKVYSAKGACMLIPKKVFEYAGKFDDDFFIFYEETDLCHRIWLSGYKVIFDPRSSIYHLAGGDTGDTYNYARRIYLTIKNMNMSYVQNFGLLLFLTVYPLFLGTQLALFIYFFIKGKPMIVREILRAWYWNVVHAQKIFLKRQKIQKLRVISDSKLLPDIFYNPGLYYYYCLLFNAKQFQDEILHQKIYRTG